MKKPYRRSLVITLLAIVSLGMPSTWAADEATEYTAVTTKDVKIPVDQLELLVKPLTQSELEGEAKAWLEILKAKVTEISAAEIAVRNQNLQIDKAKDAAAAIEEAKEAAEKAKAVAEKAGAQGSEADAEQVREAEEAAKAKLEEAAKAASEARESEVKAAEDESVQQATQAAIEQSAEADSADSGANGPTEETLRAASVATPTTPGIDVSTEGDSDGLAAAAEAADSAAEGEAELKTALLENLNQLRTERTAIAARMAVVLDEFEAKGGDPKLYREYIAAATAIKVDTKDWQAFLNYLYGWLMSEEGGKKWAGSLVTFVVILLVFWLLSVILSKAVRKAVTAAKVMSDLLRTFVVTMVRRSVLILGILVGLSVIGIKLGPVLALIGGAAFVVGFALQGTLSNFANGIMILTYRPFDVGDVIEVSGVAGKVASMNMVSTVIKTFDNKSMIVPNNKVWGEIITNATGTSVRRVDMTFGIGYGDSIAKAQAIIESIVTKHPLTLDEPAPTIKLHELGDSSMNFICRPWAKTANYWDVHWDVTRQVKEEFDRQGITIPFPQRDVHVYREALPEVAGAKDA